MGSKSLLWKKGGRPLLARTAQAQEVDAKLTALHEKLLVDPKKGTSPPWSQFFQLSQKKQFC